MVQDLMLILEINKEELNANILDYQLILREKVFLTPSQTTYRIQSNFYHYKNSIFNVLFLIHNFFLLDCYKYIRTFARNFSALPNIYLLFNNHFPI